MDEWLPEQLKTIRNLCDISLLLLEQRIDKRQTLLPTVLELLYEEAQKIVLENCVVERDIENYTS